MGGEQSKPPILYGSITPGPAPAPAPAPTVDYTQQQDKVEPLNQEIECLKEAIVANTTDSQKAAIEAAIRTCKQSKKVAVEEVKNKGLLGMQNTEQTGAQNKELFGMKSTYAIQGADYQSQAVRHGGYPTWLIVLIIAILIATMYIINDD